MVNKKAQQGPIGYIFLIIVFVAIWFIWIGKWIKDVGQQAIIDGGLTGVEAFFYANLNVVVFIGLLMGILGFMYFMGGN